MKNVHNTDIRLIKLIFVTAKEYGWTFEQVLDNLNYDFQEYHCQNCCQQLNLSGLYSYEFSSLCRRCKNNKQ